MKQSNIVGKPFYVAQSNTGLTALCINSLHATIEIYRLEAELCDMDDFDHWKKLLQYLHSCNQSQVVSRHCILKVA